MSIKLPEKLMAKETRADSRSTRRELWLSAGVYFLCCMVLQWRAHASAAAFGSYPDEPAHYIGGLLIRDYLVSGHFVSALSYARAYYASLPYFAIGYWPPLFYCVEGIWMLLFGQGRAVVLLLSASFATGSACLIFGSIRRQASTLMGFCGGLAFLAVPVVQRQISTTMLDLPVTFTVLASTIFAASYLMSGRWSDSVKFSVMAAVACLTKYSAAYVCLIPFVGIVLLRRWRLLRSAGFWAQPVIIVALLSPWVVFTARFARIGLPADRYGSVAARLWLFAKGFERSAPWPFWLLIGAGLALWSFRRVRWNEIALAFLAHLAILLAFLVSSPVAPEARYFTPAIAAALVAGFCGFRWWSARLPSYILAAILLLCTTTAFAWGLWSDGHLRVNNVRAAVEQILMEPRWRKAPILVAADAEGPMIAEFAMRDPNRPGYHLVRPSKVLASDDWFGGNYKSLFRTPAEIQSFLAGAHVRVVILPAKLGAHVRPHEILLRQAVAGNAEMWHQAGAAATEGGFDYEVFEAAASSEQEILRHVPPV